MLQRQTDIVGNETKNGKDAMILGVKMIFNMVENGNIWKKYLFRRHSVVRTENYHKIRFYKMITR